MEWKMEKDNCPFSQSHDRNTEVRVYLRKQAEKDRVPTVIISFLSFRLELNGCRMPPVEHCRSRDRSISFWSVRCALFVIWWSPSRASFLLVAGRTRLQAPYSSSDADKATVGYPCRLYQPAHAELCRDVYRGLVAVDGDGRSPTFCFGCFKYICTRSFYGEDPLLNK